MAKKLSAAKDKKAARKAETERLQQTKQQLKGLIEADNLLADFAAFCTYDRHGITAKLDFHKAEQLPQGMLDWALALTKRHMQSLYEASPNWGWSDFRKRLELADPAARYIVATCAQQQQSKEGSALALQPQPLLPQQLAQTELQPLGFVHFRFEEEEREAVLYLYEIQLEGAAQGKGLGAHLMRLLELVAWKLGCSRILLTCFYDNKAAMHMYQKLGYVADDSSPERHDPTESYSYQILTKRRKQA